VEQPKGATKIAAAAVITSMDTNVLAFVFNQFDRVLPSKSTQNEVRISAYASRVIFSFCKRRFLGSRRDN